MSGDLSEEVESRDASKRAVEDEWLEAVDEFVMIFIWEVPLLDHFPEDSFEEIVLTLDLDHVLDEALISLFHFFLH